MAMFLRIGVVVGAALLVAALFLAVREWRFIATSTHVTATVSRIDREWMSGSSTYRSSNSGGNWGYRVTAAFPIDGRMVEARSNSVTSYTGYKVGDAIAVEYPPGQPERAQLVRFVDRWMLVLVLAGIGGMFVAICGFAVWLTRLPGARITTSGAGFSVKSPVYSIEGDLRRPRSPDGSARDQRRVPTIALVAIVLIVGVAIGFLVARAGRTPGSSTADAQPVVASTADPGAAADNRTAAPAPGYPSDLTVQAPPATDNGEAPARPSWNDPANGGATRDNLTMAARAFLARPAMDATMQSALRRQVARLGIACPGLTFGVGETLLSPMPPPAFDASGTLQRGLVRQRFNAANCPGRSPEFNIWVYAAGAGAPVRTIAAYPGSTRADLALMNNATPVVLGIAARLAPACRTLAVADTRLTASASRDATSPWTEEWLVTGCGKRVATTVRFVPDGAQGTRIEVPSTLARLLPS